MVKKPIIWDCDVGKEHLLISIFGANFEIGSYSFDTKLKVIKDNPNFTKALIIKSNKKIYVLNKKPNNNIEVEEKVKGEKKTKEPEELNHLTDNFIKKIKEGRQFKNRTIK